MCSGRLRGETRPVARYRRRPAVGASGARIASRTLAEGHPHRREANSSVSPPSSAGWRSASTTPNAAAIVSARLYVLTARTVGGRCPLRPLRPRPVVTSGDVRTTAGRESPARPAVPDRRTALCMVSLVRQLPNDPKPRAASVVDHTGRRLVHQTATCVGELESVGDAGLIG